MIWCRNASAANGFTVLGHSVHLPNWSKCRFGGDQGPITHELVTAPLQTQCCTLFLPYNTKGLKIIPYSTQKTEWLTTALPDPIQYLCRPSALQIGRGTIHAFNQLTQQRFPLRLAPRLFYANTIYGKSPIFKIICGP